MLKPFKHFHYHDFVRTIRGQMAKGGKGARVIPRVSYPFMLQIRSCRLTKLSSAPRA